MDPKFSNYYSFSGEGRTLSKTEQAQTDLNLLPSVSVSQFYIRPEFDVSGLPLAFTEESGARNLPESPEFSRKPFGSEPDEIFRATELFRKEDVDHENFILPGSVNAGRLDVRGNVK